MSVTVPDLNDSVVDTDNTVDMFLQDSGFNYRTAIILATQRDRIDLVEQLVERYKNQSIGRHTSQVLYGFALKQATAANNYAAVCKLLDLGAVSLTSCIRIAAAKKYSAVLKLLVSVRRKRRQKPHVNVFQQLIDMGEIDHYLTTTKPTVSFFSFEYKKCTAFSSQSL